MNFSADDPRQSALFTDQYQLTMAQAYHAEGMDEKAVFELFYRELPPCRNYTVAAGLESALQYLQDFHFTDDDLAYLDRQGIFSGDFLERLKNLRFTGDVFAVPEGTVVFPNEPILQVEAPIIEAQLVETYLLNQVHFQTVAASKAARIMAAAKGKFIIDFGSRRAHATDAALQVARTSYMVGFAGTSNVLAGKLYGIPIYGTMAHSYIQAHDDEYQAFAAFSDVFPETTLLVDTYDTLDGVRKVIRLKQEVGEAFRIKAVRLDSGDLAELAKQSRALLDEAGLNDVHIFASSELDERKIEKLLDAGAPIDGFGVGTRLAVSEDAPDLDMAYKLVEYAGRPRLKLSSHKVLYPGRKQIFRHLEDGVLQRDDLCRHDEKKDGQALLRPVMKNGKFLADVRSSLEDTRRYAKQQLSILPNGLLSLEQQKTPFPVVISEALKSDLSVIKKAISS